MTTVLEEFNKHEEETNKQGKHSCVTMSVNHEYDDYAFTPERVASDRALSGKYLFGDRYTKGGK